MEHDEQKDPVASSMLPTVPTVEVFLIVSQSVYCRTIHPMQGALSVSVAPAQIVTADFRRGLRRPRVLIHLALRNP